jgi:hypothetical protein
MNYFQITNGLIKCGVAISNRLIESIHPKSIKLCAGEAIPTSFPIKRAMYYLVSNLVRIAAEQFRDLAVCHPNLRHKGAISCDL